MNTDKIDRKRVELGIKKAALAEMVGMSRQNLHNIYMEGNTTMETLGKIAEALGIDDPRDLIIL